VVEGTYSTTVPPVWTVYTISVRECWILINAMVGKGYLPQSTVSPTVTEEYAGIVYDLDGTLVRLAVDWEAATEEVATIFREANLEPPGDLWTMLDVAPEYDVADAVERTVAKHERAGARDSIRLDLADELVAMDRPVGICSLNAESACRMALEEHGLEDAVDTVVGRDTVPQRKPDPEPLLAAIDRLSMRPSAVIFVGDTETDAETALRAGTAFRFVDETASNTN
jgi:HAD superfamily hydrolase (TIGR01509 family)